MIKPSRSILNSIRLELQRHCIYNQHKYDEAIEACDKAIEMDPHYAVAWNNKGIALYNQHKYDEAIQACDKAIEMILNMQ